MGLIRVTSVPWIEGERGSTTYIPRLSWKEFQRVCRAEHPHEAESIDGDWRMPATRPSLASLHANPAHSALRRARCFGEACEQSCRGPESDDLMFQWEVLNARANGYLDAARTCAWSVR